MTEITNKMEYGKYYIVFYHTISIHMIHIVQAKYNHTLGVNTHNVFESMHILLDNIFKDGYVLHSNVNTGETQLNVNTMCSIFELTETEILNQIALNNI